MENSVFDDAVKAYIRYCKDNNLIVTQPSEPFSTVGRKYVHLENCNGKLATYEISSGKIIA